MIDTTRTTPALDPVGGELVPVHDASSCKRALIDQVPAPVICVAGVAGLVGFACFLALLPLTFWSMGVVVGALIAMTWIPWPRRGSWAIHPAMIADREVAIAYDALLAAHAELATMLVEPDASMWAKTLIDRSRDLVILCGRIAWTTNHQRRERERVLARLALATSSLHATSANVAKLYTVEDGVSDEADALAAAMAVCAA